MVVTAHDVHKMFFKIRVVADSHFLQQERHHNAESLEAIDRADPKVHTRRFGKVSCLHGNLGDLEAKADGLRDHLRIENKVIGVQKERHGGKQAAAERAECGKDVAVCVLAGHCVFEQTWLGQFDVIGGVDQPLDSRSPARRAYSGNPSGGSVKTPWRTPSLKSYS